MSDQQHRQASLSAPSGDSVSSQAIELKHGYEVQIGTELSLLEVLDPTGQLTLSVRISEEGPVIHISGAQLKVEATEKLSLHSNNIDIHAGELLSIRSEGRIEEEAATGKLSMAEEHEVRARLGDIKLKANDDIKLNGERVKLNCDE